MENNKINNKALCLSSSGPKGIIMLGKLHKMKDPIPTFNKFIGSSIGAVIITLLIFGYTPMEIFEEVRNNPAKLRKLNLSFYKTYSLFDVNPFMKNFANMLIKKLNNFNLDRIPTLRDLYYITGKELVIVAINISTKKIVYFSYKTHPNLYVDIAIRMTISIPVIFPSFKYKGSYFIDPGFIEPFPINYFDDGNTDIIGITINTKFEEENTFISYIRQLFYTSIELNSVRRIKECSNRCKIFIIPVINGGDLKFNTTSSLNKNIKEKLFEIGYKY